MKCSEVRQRLTERGVVHVGCTEDAIGEGHHCREHTTERLSLTQQRLQATSLRMQQRVGAIVTVELQMAVLEREQSKDRAAYLSDYQRAKEHELALHAPPQPEMAGAVG